MATWCCALVLLHHSVGDLLSFDTFQSSRWTKLFGGI